MTPAKPSTPFLPDKRFVEFFAGIGLVAKGLEPSGWRCTYANDIDPKKKNLYDHNFTSHECDLRDIWDVDAILPRVGSPLLATASFPCTDLSLAGHGRGFGGKHSSAFFGFVQILDRLGTARPPLIMVENVVGFLTARGGSDFAIAARALADQGYYLDVFILDARLFVPQSRPRVFIIGFQEAVTSDRIARQSSSYRLEDPWYTSLRLSSALRPPKLVTQMMSISLSTGWACSQMTTPTASVASLDTLIDQDGHQKWWDEPMVSKHYQSMSDRHKAYVDDAMASGRREVGTGYRRKRNGTTRLEVRFDGIAGCLRTPRGGSARQIVVYINRGELRMRWMSAIEYARLQGIGDFMLLENEREMLFGFGDAVCVPAISWIDTCVLTPIARDISTHN